MFERKGYVYKFMDMNNSVLYVEQLICTIE